MIEVKNLTHKYGSFVAVNNISFSINKGEILGLLGPNGAGKTTTMRILTCYIPPTSGEVTIGGINVLKDTLSIRKLIGYLPENAPLYQDMIVFDFLKYIAEMRNIKKSNIKDKIYEVSEICGIKKIVGKAIHELSKGYNQRVGLAQALIHDPEILILDEPTSGLDPLQAIEIRDLLKKIGQEKLIIYSSHIMPVVEATCDRAIIMKQGEIVADNTIKGLHEKYEGSLEEIFRKLTKQN